MIRAHKRTQQATMGTSVRKAASFSGRAVNEANVKTVRTTPWSVFVPNSPLYITSQMPRGQRAGRPGSNQAQGVHRRLPYRPDGYPYADRRWTERLTGKRAGRKGIGAL
jgi:hypothetical protein